MKICIVSPHLDDALLSCGILMQRHVAASNEVFVLNIFTAGTNAANRRTEEQNAMAKAGAAVFFLDELDAPDRNPVYWANEKLFFGALDDVPADYISKVENRLHDFFAEHKIDLAYFPLGAGNHIDHRITYTAGLRIKDTPVKFYEDRPYILWPGVLQGRMNQIGSNAVLPVITAEAMRAGLGGYHYLKHFVPEGAYQQECLPLYFQALNQPSSNTLHAASETLVATEAELKHLYDCLAMYESQMGFIYPDYETFVKDSLAYEQATSGQRVYAERSWTLSPALLSA
ncbi:MAG: PIG-L family deacetylase [Alphaproteobacteria bacterium]|nr:PIG-L family deacetylase [Alphaproteobacteria bacterium]